MATTLTQGGTALRAAYPGLLNITPLGKNHSGKNRNQYYTESIAPRIAAIGLGLATSFTSALVLLLLVSAASGMVGPLKQALLHHHVPAAQRATVLSVDSLFGNGGAVVGQVGPGVWARERGIPQACFVGGLFTLLALPLLARARPGRR